MISLFDLDSDAMLSCKAGNWWELNPQRGRSNNSAVILRHKIDVNTFVKLWERIEASGSGEPGTYLTNDRDYGTNPCAEISLRPFQMCNLTEINMSNVDSQDDFNERCVAASFIGTLQASYTDFHYLRDVWKRNTEKDALIGVSMTGIASDFNMTLNFEEGASLVKETNIKYASLIGINSAARTTTVKPAGTTSLVLGTSSGIHAWHNDYYIRRMRIGKNEAIYNFLAQNHPNLIEDEYFRPTEQAVLSIPQAAPQGAITRHESVFDILNRVQKIYNEWIKPGHNRGPNTHNVSCTVSIKPDEWANVGAWMWNNRDSYNGLSVLPYNGGTYKQTPFEDCTKEVYEELSKTLVEVNLSDIKEVDDNTNLQGELACAGGSCEIV
jgi:ribonucleoside-triphosphate reductase (thioredoxin)